MQIDIEKAVRTYLDNTFHLSLATVSGDTPWVSEVHFAYDEDLNLYFRSLPTRRHSQEIAANPKVAGNVIKQHDLGEQVVGVYFEGMARRLEPGEEQNKAFECIARRLRTGNGILSEAQHVDGHQFYKVSVKTWYVFGTFGTASGQKYQLDWPGGTGSAA
jgi:uncharacterized protein YhbP (UPF0306 family)